jgi:methionyl-tRNA synthetase
MRILIAAAWPYASGPRHLGHAAGAYLPADVVARYHRLAGDDVLFVSGSDQHGTPITIAAERRGVSPAAFADEQHDAIAASFGSLGISFDLYTKTSTPLHRKIVQDLFLRLHRNGFIDEGVERSAWCPAEERSVPDRYVEGTCPACGAPDARGDQCDACGRTFDSPGELGGPRCRRCGSQAVFRELSQLFLRLDLLQPLVERYLAEHADAWEPFVASEARGWIREGLRPRAVTRDLAWGVPVPLESWDARRLYVWFDAVIGYLSASIEWSTRSGDPEAWMYWWRDPEAVHRYFVGKDNIPFHAVWWPAILAGADDDLHLPDDILATHHLTLGGARMSASREHGFTIDEALDSLGVDPLRHALIALRPETNDAPFTWEKAGELTRTGLLGQIANPAYRVASLLWERFGGRCDEAAWRTDALGDRSRANEALERVGAEIRAGRLRDALAGVHDIGRQVNRRLATTEPWHLPDRDARREITRLLPFLDALGVAALPFVPATASRVAALLGRPAADRWTTGAEPPRATAPPEPPLRTAGAEQITTSRPDASRK